jgi:large subunit ribosomal protein L15
MLKLNNLAPLVKKRKRVGRGGSRGGTAGKGHKGQKARSGGYVRPGFEGGQMPLYRRLPKRGFNNKEFRTYTALVNLGALNDFFNDGDVITKDTLLERGIIKVRKGEKFFLKILADGELKKKLTISADKFSGAALTMIERAGGQAQVIKEN